MAQKLEPMTTEQGGMIAEALQKGFQPGSPEFYRFIGLSAEQNGLRATRNLSPAEKFFKSVTGLTDEEKALQQQQLLAVETAKALQPELAKYALQQQMEAKHAIDPRMFTKQVVQPSNLQDIFNIRAGMPPVDLSTQLRAPTAPVMSGVQGLTQQPQAPIQPVMPGVQGLTQSIGPQPSPSFPAYQPPVTQTVMKPLPEALAQMGPMSVERASSIVPLLKELYPSVQGKAQSDMGKLLADLEALPSGHPGRKFIVNEMQRKAEQPPDELVKLQRMRDELPIGSKQREEVENRIEYLTSSQRSGININKIAQSMYPGIKDYTSVPDEPMTAQDVARIKQQEKLTGTPFVAAVGLNKKAAADATLYQRQVAVAGAQAGARQQVELTMPLSQHERDTLFDRKAFLDKGELRRLPPGVTRQQAATADVFEFSDQQRQAWQGLQVARKSADTLFDVADELITAKNSIQAASQATRLYAGAYSKSNPTAAAYLADKQAFSSTQSRAVGTERGVLTNTDIVRWEKTLPELGDTVQIKNVKKALYNRIYNATEAAMRRVLAGENPNEVRNDPGFRRQLDQLLKQTDKLVTSSAADLVVESEPK